ncbi:MAG: glutathione peroxidase, partial [Bacteroidaceae bacterium]|nr:glutathione peroxidase [Bacteroidaceae bacterium]
LDAMLLKQDANYAQKPDIKWNFTKFLIDRKGRVVRRYEPNHSLKEIEQDIIALMGQQ